MTPACPHCGGAPSGYRQSRQSPWLVTCRRCAHNATAPTLKEALNVWARGESTRHDAAKGSEV